MVVITRISTRTLSSDDVLRELAKLCISDLKVIYKRCSGLKKPEDRARCKSSIAFALHYARKTGLVYESDGGVLYFVPCLLYYKAVASYLYERPRKLSSKTLVELRDRYKWLKIASEEILKAASTTSSLIVDRNSFRVENIKRDIKSAVKWVMKSPLYRHLMQYTTSLSTMCRVVHYLFLVIPSTCNNPSACELNKLMLTYSLSTLVALTETLVRLEWEGKLTVKNAVENLKEVITVKSMKPLHVSNQLVDGIAHAKKDALLKYLTSLVNSSVSTHIALEHFVQALERNLLSKRASGDSSTSVTEKAKTIGEARKLKWMGRKLLRYNMAFRIYGEVSRLNGEVASTLLQTLL